MNLDWGWLENNTSDIAQMLGQHALLAVIPVLAALVIALPLGYLVHRTGTAANAILAVLGVVYSIPSLALFVALPLVLGTSILSQVNVVVALTIYSVALLVRSVVDGLRSVPADVKQSASAVGFSRFGRLMKVELPLAMPEIMLGINQTILLALSMIIIAAMIGTRDLGQEVFIALAKADAGRGVVAGLAVACIGIVADRLIGGSSAKARARLTDGR